MDFDKDAIKDPYGRIIPTEVERGNTFIGWVFLKGARKKYGERPLDTFYTVWYVRYGPIQFDGWKKIVATFTIFIIVFRLGDDSRLLLQPVNPTNFERQKIILHQLPLISFTRVRHDITKFVIIQSVDTSSSCITSALENLE